MRVPTCRRLARRNRYPRPLASCVRFCKFFQEIPNPAHRLEIPDPTASAREQNTLTMRPARRLEMARTGSASSTVMLLPHGGAYRESDEVKDDRKRC